MLAIGKIEWSEYAGIPKNKVTGCPACAHIYRRAILTSKCTPFCIIYIQFDIIAFRLQRCKRRHSLVTPPYESIGKLFKIAMWRLDNKCTMDCHTCSLIRYYPCLLVSLFIVHMYLSDCDSHPNIDCSSCWRICVLWFFVCLFFRRMNVCNSIALHVSASPRGVITYYVRDIKKYLFCCHNT